MKVYRQMQDNIVIGTLLDSIKMPLLLPNLDTSRSGMGLTRCGISSIPWKRKPLLEVSRLGRSSVMCGWVAVTGMVR